MVCIVTKTIGMHAMQKFPGFQDGPVTCGICSQHTCFPTRFVGQPHANPPNLPSSMSTGYDGAATHERVETVTFADGGGSPGEGPEDGLHTSAVQQPAAAPPGPSGTSGGARSTRVGKEPAKKRGASASGGDEDGDAPAPRGGKSREPKRRFAHTAPPPTPEDGVDAAPYFPDRVVLPDFARLRWAVYVPTPSFLKSMLGACKPVKKSTDDAITLWVCNQAAAPAGTTPFPPGLTPDGSPPFSGFAVDQMDNGESMMIMGRMRAPGSQVYLKPPHAGGRATKDVPCTVLCSPLESVLKTAQDFQRVYLYQTEGAHGGQDDKLHVLITSDARSHLVFPIPIVAMEPVDHKEIGTILNQLTVVMPLKKLQELVQLAIIAKETSLWLHVKRWSGDILMLVLQGNQEKGLIQSEFLEFESALAPADPDSEDGRALQQWEAANQFFNASGNGEQAAAKAALDIAAAEMRQALVKFYDRLPVPEGYRKPARRFGRSTLLADCEREIRDLILDSRVYQAASGSGLPKGLGNTQICAVAKAVESPECVADAPASPAAFVNLADVHSGLYKVDVFRRVATCGMGANVRISLPLDKTDPICMRVDADVDDNYVAYMSMQSEDLEDGGVPAA